MCTLTRPIGTILVLLPIFLFSRPAQAKYDGGSGTADDPYQIWTAEQMNAIGAEPNDWDKHFKLMADIDLSGFDGKGGRPVFNIIAPDTDPNDQNSMFQGVPFTGVFDGNSHTISNFTYTSTARDYIGLFGYVSDPNAQIKNLGLVGTNVDAREGRDVGSLVGCNLGGTITQCYVEGGSVSGQYIVGGLVGYNGRLVIHCYSTAAVIGTKTDIGGLVAVNWGTVTQCYSTGAVAGGGDVGGLVGINWYGTVTQCYSTGTVSGSAVIGGLVGFNYYGTVTHCYSTGTVKAASEVGGLVGRNGGAVTRCYSTGAVTGTGNCVGGLAGNDDYCWGWMDPQCWHGGATACFWDIQTSGQVKSAGGAGKTTAEMETGRTFRTWGTCESERVWTIDEGKDYPRLRWENQPGEAIRMATLSGLLLGTGTENDPFLIYTPEELNMVGLFPCEWDKHFKLMADIDLSALDGKYGRPEFNMIAPGRSLWDVWDQSLYSVGTPFTGVFDGNTHIIWHLTLTVKDEGCGGLIGGLGPGAKVKDLGVVDVNITSSGAGVGGLVGYNHAGTVTQCYSTGAVDGNDMVGGLVGANAGHLAQCYSACAVSGNEQVGGLMGNSSNSNVTHCYSTGTVSGHHNVGGLVGYNGGHVANCYSTSVVGGTGVGVGGLVGGNTGSANVSDCYSTGAVSGATEHVGGLVGYSDVIVTGCFWDIQTSGRVWSAGGTGKTTAEMQTASTFLEADWDFVNVWGIGENQTYPYLRKYSAADINQDGSINLLDLAVLAENWLTSLVP